MDGQTVINHLERNVKRVIKVERIINPALHVNKTPQCLHTFEFQKRGDLCYCLHEYFFSKKKKSLTNLLSLVKHLIFFLLL